MSRTSIFLAYKILRGNDRGLLNINARLSLVGVFFSASLLVMVLSIFNGFQKTIKDSIFNFESHLTIFNPFGNTQIKQWKKYTKDIQTHLRKDIKSVSGMIQSPALIRVHNQIDYIFLRSHVLQREKTGWRISDELLKIVIPHTLHYMPHRHSCLIGKEMATAFNLQIGDSIELIVPNGNLQFRQGVTPSIGKYKIAGFFKTGHYHYDSKTVILPLEEMQSLFKIHDNVQQIGIKLHHLSQIEYVQNELIKLLPFSLNMRTIKDEQKNFFAALKMEKTIMSIILFLFILTAMAGIIIATLNTIRSQRKEIGVLKALGMQNQEILFIFTWFGFIIGNIGAFTGILFGVYLAQNVNSFLLFIENCINTVGYWYSDIVPGAFWYEVDLLAKDTYYFDKIPIFFDIPMLHILYVVTVFMAVLSSSIPAFYASKIRPIEIIKE